MIGYFSTFSDFFNCIATNFFSTPSLTRLCSLLFFSSLSGYVRAHHYSVKLEYILPGAAKKSLYYLLIFWSAVCINNMVEYVG